MTAVAPVLTIAELGQRLDAWRDAGVAYVIRFRNGRIRPFKAGQLRAAVEQLQLSPGAEIFELAFARAVPRDAAGRKHN